jgi:adenosine kinase
MDGTRVVVCGSIALDRIMNFVGNYHELIDVTNIDVLSLSVIVDSMSLVEGGIAGNIAHNLAQLGQDVSLLGSIGSDGFTYLERLEGMGIDVSKVHHSTLPSGSFSVLTDSGGNQVGGFYPGAMMDADSLSFMPWIESGEDFIACLSAHNPAAMRRQTEECLEHQARMIYDPGQQVSTVPPEDMQLGIKAAEMLIVNEYEYRLLLQRTNMNEQQLRDIVPILVVTHGKEGSRIFDRQHNKAIEIGIVKPEQYADPTGAGDAYRAGFLYGYLRQWELQQCGELGAATASFALEHVGPQTPFNLEEVARRYEEAFKRKVPT